MGGLKDLCFIQYRGYLGLMISDATNFSSHHYDIMLYAQPTAVRIDRMLFGLDHRRLSVAQLS
jgi:hypothetical protein